MLHEKIKGQLYRYGNAAIKKIRTYIFQSAIDKFGIKTYGRTFSLNNLKFNMILNNEDKGLSRQLIRSDWREYNSTKYFIEEFLGDEEIILELGANIGYFALIEAAKSIRNVIYAVEPVSENYSILSANVAWNGLNNIKCFKAAIGDECGETEITICEHKNWSSIDQSRANEIALYSNNIIKEKVRVYDIQSFIQTYVQEEAITLIRMDIEGYEYNVLSGNAEFLEKCKPKLFVEFHTNILGKNKTIELLKLLRDMGYEIDKCIKNLEYCGDELLFQPVSGRGTTREISIERYIEEFENKSTEQVLNEEGVELFLR